MQKESIYIYTLSTHSKSVFVDSFPLLSLAWCHNARCLQLGTYTTFASHFYLHTHIYNIYIYINIYKYNFIFIKIIIICEYIYI